MVGPGQEPGVQNKDNSGSTGRHNDAFGEIMAALESAHAIELRLTALAMVRDGVITGEGPTASGRIHFSRCIDATDTEFIRRILIAGAGSITREEADQLFDIHDAAIERIDNGAFDALLTRAVVHHVTAAETARAAAFAADIDWPRLQASVLDGDTATWLKARLNRRRRQDGPIAELARIIGASPAWNGAAVAADLAA
jgi:hypothetical protein